MSSIKQKEYDGMFMDFAENHSRMSKCVRVKVGAVLVRDNRIISHGVNGTIPGEMNCCDRFPAFDRATQGDAHHEWSDRFEFHAEANCIAYALESKQVIRGATLYVTVAPCFQCMKSFIGLFGISRVVYSDVYDRVDIRDVERAAEYYHVNLEQFDG